MTMTIFHDNVTQNTLLSVDMPCPPSVGHKMTFSPDRPLANFTPEAAARMDLASRHKWVVTSVIHSFRQLSLDTCSPAYVAFVCCDRDEH